MMMPAYTIIRPGTSQAIDRTPKQIHRDRIAAQMAEYLARGGKVTELPGPGNGISNRIGHGRSAVLTIRG